MTAAELLGNSHLAWRISQPAPVGDATAEEAAHPTVVEKAVLIAAELGLLDDVSRMLGEVEDPLVRHQADALVARRRGDSDAERSSWLEASYLVQSADDHYRIGMQLAMFGIQPDGILTLAATNPEAAAPGCS